MTAIIKNLRLMQGMGIFADRDGRSAPLELRRYNLLYGFNGSGKSTLSRLFASLELGALHLKMPEDCSFDVVLDDGTNFGCPLRPTGLERRLLVFNTDYIDQNLQWTIGRASPVFFIGANQAEAAAVLAKTEELIVKQAETKLAAEGAEKSATKNFADFKRERAKLTAARLHLGSRKYEAPALAKDYDAWGAGAPVTLTVAELKAAEDTRMLTEPMPRLSRLEFDASSIVAAYKFITEICSQSLTTVALDEIQRFPDMLLWLKQGHEFHDANGIEDCLLCGNPISAERRTLLATALDSQVDAFVAKLAKTAERLASILSTLARLEETIPQADTLMTEIRPGFVNMRAEAVRQARQARDYLRTLQDVLSRKQDHPATPIDMSAIASQTDVATAATALAQAIEGTNSAIATHNDATGNFATHKDEAEIAIRKHFIAECGTDYAKYARDFCGAQAKLVSEDDELKRLRDLALQLRQQIKEHGPAAGAINTLIASYLGHGELTIHPIEQGYELHRHGNPIRGAPSEGEKTAIAISYFLSSIEAEGRKIKDLIVVIDDPVSSLDTKALNYACSLIRSRLGDAAQLFILTHNLQCMNEFRKAWKGRARPPEGKEPRGLSSNGTENLHKGRGLAAADFWTGKCEIESLPAARR